MPAATVNNNNFSLLTELFYVLIINYRKFLKLALYLTL